MGGKLAMLNTRVTVRLADQEIALKGTEDEAYITQVASYVNEMYEDVLKKQPALSTTNAVVLCAINIADELFKLKQQYAQMDKRIEELKKLTSAQQPITRHSLNTGAVKRPFDKPEQIESVGSDKMEYIKNP